MAIYSEFSHEKWWFSIATLNYQRVNLRIDGDTMKKTGETDGNGLVAIKHDDLYHLSILLPSREYVC
jgi:hypothetical protein